jgi:ubiquinone/menaquinone biosynthesis C-methylase UbiE
MMKNERFIWATALMAIKPGQHILEIGCGAGILVEQIASRLSSGTITAIDRSAAMISQTKKRNKPYISSQKVVVKQGSFAQLELPATQFDKIVAFNVNCFWKDPGKELALIREILRPNGELYIFHQAPFEIDITAAIPLENKLRCYEFIVMKRVLKKLSPTSAFCVIAKPGKHPGRR